MSNNNQKYIEILNEIKNDNNFYTSNKNLNSAYFRRDYFLKSNLYKNITEATNFLDISVSLSERIYCIINNITEISKCICGVNLRFISNIIGYKSSCSKCFRKINKNWKSPKETINSNIIKERKELLDYILNEEMKSSSYEEMMEFISLNTQIISESSTYITRTDIKNNKHILKKIIEETKSIPLDIDNFEWSNRFYNIIHNKHEGQLCAICNTNKTRYINLKKGYTICCSDKKCVQTYGCKNRVISHIENILPSINEQGFNLINKTNFNGLNTEKTKLFCNTCNSSIECDISDGKWKNIRCYNCYGKVGISYEEKTVLNHVKQYETNILENYKISNTNKELDIYIPNKKIAIEYNGGLWHSFGINFPNNISDELKNKNKHFNKFKQCNDLNINLLQINSYEWSNLNKQNIWKSIINNKLKINNKIYARKCKILELCNKQKNDFLNINHLQGMDNSKIKLGLEYEGRLVSVMTFSKPRFNKNYEWELVRFCNLLNYNVIGAASKLLKHFIKNHNPKTLISYADLRYSNGNLYKKLGFEFKKYTPPSYVYIKGDKVLSRFSCQKNKLSKILSYFDENKSESQNMIDNNYRKLWDAGTMLFVLSK